MIENRFMTDAITLSYVITDPLELNLSYMPFINEGGIFVPTQQSFSLGTNVLINLQLPGKKESISIEGKVVWITSKNALHHVLPGIGVQFTGSNTATIRSQIEALLDKSTDVGGYVYGITDESMKEKK